MAWFVLGVCLLVFYLVSTHTPLWRVVGAAAVCGVASLLLSESAAPYADTLRSLLNGVVLAGVAVVLIRLRGSSQFQRSRGYRHNAPPSLGRGAGEGSGS